MILSHNEAIFATNQPILLIQKRFMFEGSIDLLGPPFMDTAKCPGCSLVYGAEQRPADEKVAVFIFACFYGNASRNIKTH